MTANEPTSVKESDSHHFRLDAPPWNLFVTLAGRGAASKVIKQFILWYIRWPGADLPDRPPATPER